LRARRQTFKQLTRVCNRHPAGIPARHTRQPTSPANDRADNQQRHLRSPPAYAAPLATRLTNADRPPQTRGFERSQLAEARAGGRENILVVCAEFEGAPALRADDLRGCNGLPSLVAIRRHIGITVPRRMHLPHCARRPHRRRVRARQRGAWTAPASRGLLRPQSNVGPEKSVQTAMRMLDNEV
jgi:hypothetical protein